MMYVVVMMALMTDLMKAIEMAGMRQDATDEGTI